MIRTAAVLGLLVVMGCGDGVVDGWDSESEDGLVRDIAARSGAILGTIMDVNRRGMEGMNLRLTCPRKDGAGDLVQTAISDRLGGFTFVATAVQVGPCDLDVSHGQVVCESKIFRSADARQYELMIFWDTEAGAYRMDQAATIETMLANR